MNEWDAIPPGAASWVTLTFPDAGVSVLAEIAKDTERGLTGRTRLPEGQGMLFDMVASRDHAFWMKNVPIALDMVFVSQAHIIVGILRNVPPYDVTLRSVGVASRYVLEVPGGWAARYGVEVGQLVD